VHIHVVLRGPFGREDGGSSSVDGFIESGSRAEAREFCHVSHKEDAINYQINSHHAYSDGPSTSKIQSTICGGRKRGKHASTVMSKPLTSSNQPSTIMEDEGALTA
jgi:hypothetical protein